ncbi:hypothetical protein ABKN59_001835 [Abortiporus biennis]
MFPSVKPLVCDQKTHQYICIKGPLDLLGYRDNMAFQASLPPEIWLHVLEVGWSDLDIEDIKSMTLVQKAFRQISQPYVFSRQSFNIPITCIWNETLDPIHDEEKNHLVKQEYYERCKSRLEFICQDRIVSGVRRLTIVDCRSNITVSDTPIAMSNFVHPNVVLDTIFAAMKLLQKLYQFESSSLCVTHNHLVTLSSLKSLTTIRLEQCDFDLDSFQDKETLPLSSLRVLSLLTSDWKKALGPIKFLLSSTLEVLELDIGGDESQNEHILQLLSSKSSPSLPRLTSLEMGVPIGDDATTFLELLKKLPSLERITMYNTDGMFHNPPATFIDRLQESLTADVSIIPRLQSVTASYHIAIPLMKSRSLHSIVVTTYSYGDIMSQIASDFHTTTGIGLIPQAHWQFLGTLDISLLESESSLDCIISVLPMFDHLTNLRLSIQYLFSVNDEFCQHLLSHLPKTIEITSIGNQQRKNWAFSRNLLDPKMEKDIQERYPDLLSLQVYGHGTGRLYLEYPEGEEDQVYSPIDNDWWFEMARNPNNNEEQRYDWSQYSYLFYLHQVFHMYELYAKSR